MLVRSEGRHVGERTRASTGTEHYSELEGVPYSQSHHHAFLSSDEGQPCIFKVSHSACIVAGGLQKVCSGVGCCC